MNKTTPINSALCLVHMPPPLYGVTAISQYVIDECLKDFDPVWVISINSSKNIQSIGLVGVRKIYFVLKTTCRIIHSLIRQRFSFCYMTLTPTGIGFIKDCLFAVIVKAFRVKLVFHLHGKGVRDVINPLCKWLYRIVFKNEFVILLAQSLYDDVKAYVPPENVYILPNGIAKICCEEKAECENESTVILCIANMFRSKGVLDVLKVMREIAHDAPMVHAIFAGAWGDIAEEFFFAKAKKLGVADKITYAGFVTGEEKERLYQKADIFLYPTYNDTFPLVILEAMQHSLSIVSTFEGVIPEMIEEGISGSLFPKGDIQSCVRVVRQLIENVEIRKTLGRNARQRFEENYTMDIFEANIKRIMQSIGSRV